MLQTHSFIPLKTLTDDLHPPFTSSSSQLPQSCLSQPSKLHRFLVRSSSTDSGTVPKSAIQRIADKLRSLGFSEEETSKKGILEPNGTSSPGEIFIPLPKKLPKYRVGHTIDSSWSTPEKPVPEPGSGSAITRFHELKGEVDEQKRLERKKAKSDERVPTLAELSFPEVELERLRKNAIPLKKKVKVGKAGITEGIVNSIHENWRRSEVVKIVCEDLCRFNMKRTHHLLETKTGGFVIWRSGSKILLYRGANYKYPYFLADKVLKIESSGEPLLDSQSNNGGYRDAESCDGSGEKLAEASSPDKMVDRSLIQGVGSPNRVRFQLPGEAQLVEEADSLLEGLGPRFTDWWGSDPLPIDADFLPATVPAYRRPFRLLPFGVMPKLTNDEMTTLRRLSRPLPCHFALGRNRKLQGLAASIIRLWEKSEIAKIAIKRGVQNTNSEIMAEELSWLTGGTLLSRDREFIVLYRGKDFLPLAVSSAIERRRNHEVLKEKQTESTELVTTVQNQKLETVDCIPEKEDTSNVKRSLHTEKSNKSAKSSVERTSIKLALALKKKANAEKLLAELEKEENLHQPEIDKEGITAEERYMLRKVGLRMKPFLLLGRRGVFDGTIENMHLHWKYRELVKIISGDRSAETVLQVARMLEAESGGILVAVERVNKGYAIIIYRGKNYIRPSQLRPETLLNKKQAMWRSKEAQRAESLKLHVLRMTDNVEELKLKLNKKQKECISLQSADQSKLQGGEEEINSVQSIGSLRISDADAESNCIRSSAGCSEGKVEAELKSVDHSPSINTTNYVESISQQDKLNRVLPYDNDEASEDESESSYLFMEDIHTNVYTDTSTTNYVESISQQDKLNRVLPTYDNNEASEDESDSSDLFMEDIDTNVYTDTSTDVAAEDSTLSQMNSLVMKASVKSSNHESEPLLPAPSTVSNHWKWDKETPSIVKLSNKERLLLRKQALKMKKRPVLSVGRSNMVTGVAKTIRTHFKKHPLAIVNVKGRAKGTSVQEVVSMLERETGGVLVSQEPSKVILYRGWGAEDGRGYGLKKADHSIEKDGKTQPVVSPELLAAIRIECGLQ